MSNRILFGNRGGGRYGLYVSQPGYDATSAPDKNLLFSSDWRHAPIYMRGSRGISPRGDVYTVSFDKSFGRRPLVVWGVAFNNNSSILTYYIGDGCYSVWAGGGGGGGGGQNYQIVWVNVYNNRFDISSRSDIAGFSGRVLHYIVWDLNL